MKHIAIPALIVLAACAQPAPIDDYNAPYEGKWSPRPEPRPEQNVCPPKSPYAGKPVKEGHEDALCYGETKEQAPEPKEPETECARNAWAIGQRVAPGYDVGCA